MTSWALNAWIGLSRVELLGGFGPPTRTLQDGENEVYVYSWKTEYAQVKNRSNVMFWIDPDGHIQKWSQRNR